MLGIENVKITPELLRSLCGIDEFKGFWTGLESHMTGLQMLKEVAEFPGDFKKLIAPLKGQAITPAVISILHAARMKSSALSPYRDKSLEPETPSATEPSRIKDDIEELVNWFNAALEERALHPLLVIAAFTAVFLLISPFEEENPATARFMIAALMFRSGYSYAPYIPLERIFDQRAREIHESLGALRRSAEARSPEWDGWLTCFLGMLLDQKNALRERIYEKSKAMTHLPTLSGRILRLFDHHKRLQMKQIVKLTNGRRSTVKLRIGEMVDGGYLRRYGSARSTWYSLS